MLDHLIINLDPKSDASLQAQLRQSVVEAILSRAILPGDKLPSSRALADQLVSLATQWFSPIRR